MAESFLFNIAKSLVTKCASPAFEAAIQVIGAYDDLKLLNERLLYIQAVLLDAEQKVLDAEHKQERNHELRQWLKQIKHVFLDAENVLDEVECEMLREQVVKAHGSAKTKVGRFFSDSNPLVFRYNMAQQVKEIRIRLDEVAAHRDKFGLRVIEVDRRVVHRRETYSHVVGSDVIGREQDKGMIIELLMKQNPGGDDRSISVIPIVGIGGLGKTTLAKFVFSDSMITESFPLKMWVCVSIEFDIKQLIVKIINAAGDHGSADAPIGQHNLKERGQHNLKELDMEQLQNDLKNKLAGQKFLLVLDDVWNEDRVKWVELMNFVQMGAKGSKILVTTRSPTIASMVGTVPSHILPGLSQEDSLSLFVKWAFKEGEEEKYPKLVMIGRDIMKKCGGVPLAVRTLGSSLFSKFEMGKWESVRDSEILNLSQKENDILPALKLSYDQMPSYLRQCFSLFSLFPKDYSFDGMEVASLWGALGLLPSSNNNKTWTDVANQYLYELMSRSFLQDFIDLGTIYCFEMHDLVHDLAVYVAQNECLLVNSYTTKIPENVQHLSFAENDMLGEFSALKSARVKTIMFPIDGKGFDNKALLDTWVSMYKYLRVLDLSDSTYEVLPWSIGRLKHLRYLNLSNNEKIKRLPDSICELQSLQVFMLRGCTELEALPEGLRKLVSLRDFEITTKQTVLHENEFANLSSLQNLTISFCNNIESLFVGIKLPNLKTLIVESCESMKFLPLSFKHFPQLETLIVMDCDKLELSDGHDSGIQHSNLRLKFVNLESLPQLVTLPNWLQAAADTLLSLVIEDCQQLEMLPEWLSTLSFLKILSIEYCPKLMSLPNDFHGLGALEYLGVRGCPELWRKYQRDVGEYWPKISHIKRVEIFHPEDIDEEEWEFEQEEEVLEEEQEEKENFMWRSKQEDCCCLEIFKCVVYKLSPRNDYAS